MNKIANIGRFLTILAFVGMLAACGGGDSGTSPSPGPGASNNANLSSLRLSAGSLNPAFNSSTTSYNVDAVLDSSVTVTATLADANASMTVNGKSTNSGTPSSPIALAVGTNTITVQVTAEDGTTVNTYHLTVTRTVATTTNAELSSLSVSAGLLNIAFDSNTLNYIVNVANNVSTTTVTASTAQASASMTINGDAASSSIPSAPINLNVGANPIPIVVTAADGVTTKTYTVTVNRAAIAGSNASLSGLTVSSGILDQSFSPGVLAYTSGVSFLDTSILVTPTAQDSNAFISVNNVSVTSGEASQAVALVEGNNTIEITVVSADGSQSNTYTIRVTRETANQFAQQAYVKATQSRINAGFGCKSAFGASNAHCLSLDGDTLAVSMMLDEWEVTGISYHGGVYIFVRSNGVWTLQQHIIAATEQAVGTTEQPSLYGANVSLSGDTLVVGAPTGSAGYTTDNEYGSGRVYVYTRNAGVWTQQAILKASNPDMLDRFGDSIAVHGDTLAVGAPWEGSPARSINGDQGNDIGPFTAQGAVYVFTRSGNAWSQQAYIKASNTDRGDLFGSDLALFADTLVVHAPNEASNTTVVFNGDQDDNSTPGRGAIYVFTRSGNDWSQQGYIKNDEALVGKFGYEPVIYEDTLAVRAASGITYYQLVNVYTRNGSTWSKQASLHGGDNNNNFGNSIGLYRDTLVIGASGNDSNAAGINGNENDNSRIDSGAAYIFARNGNSWSQQAFIKANYVDAGDFFGYTVAISGDTIAIASPLEDSDASGIDGDQSNNLAPSSGAVFIYQ